MTENKSAQDFFAAGMTEFAGARYDKSIELLTSAIETDPTYTMAIVGRGASYLKLDMLDMARDDFDHAVKVDPADHPIGRTIG